ncbi:MAG: hypothetical protein Kapaf2KO_00880 [Candidatus Kapaibacteriales bacterium]
MAYSIRNYKSFEADLNTKQAKTLLIKTSRKQMIISRNFNTLLLFIFTLSATLTFSKDKSVVIAEVGNEKLTYEQLEKAYNKNLRPDSQGFASLAVDSAYSFIKLYTDFRLKVKDSRERGFDKNEEVKAELDNTLENLTKNSLFKKELIKPYVEKSLDRRAKEFQISYILIPDDTTGNDPKKTAKEAIKKLKGGTKFAQVAKDYSADPTTREVGGFLETWATAGRLQPDLEEAVYSIKPGEYYPEIVETSSGNFIVKLENIETRKAVESRHILFGASQVGDGDWDIQKAIADSVYRLLKDGADFAVLASEFSSDAQSADNGGLLEGLYFRSGGFVNRGGRLVAEYEKALFDLEDGEISKPVKTRYGYHIIQRLRTELSDPEEEEEVITQLYKRTNFEEDKEALSQKLLQENGLRIDQSVLNEYLNQVDSSKTSYDETWVEGLKDQTRNKTLFEILGNKITVGHYIKEVESRRDMRGVSNKRTSAENAIEKIAFPYVIDKYYAEYMKNDEDFASLSKEFEEGILLFKVESEEVWDRLSFDTLGAKKYFDQIDERFMTDYIIDFTEIYLLNDSTYNMIKDKIDNGEQISELAGQYTERSAYKARNGKWIEQEWKKNKLLLNLDKDQLIEGKIISPIKVDLGKSIVKLDKVRIPREKTFEESIPNIATDYQDYKRKNLQQEWLEGIKKKHEVKIYKDRLQKVHKG